MLPQKLFSAVYSSFMKIKCTFSNIYKSTHERDDSVSK